MVCTHCQESTYFIINDDGFEVCESCGFVQNTHFEEQAPKHQFTKPDYSNADPSNNEEDEIVFPTGCLREEKSSDNKLRQKIKDLSLLFHKKSAQDKCLQLYMKLKKNKPKEKKISDDKILKYAFYISSNDEKCPLALPNFLSQCEMTLKQFNRISRIFHSNFIAEEPKQHLANICWHLNITNKEQNLISKVSDDIHSLHFEEHTLFTFLAILIHGFSLYTRNSKNQINLDEICNVCGSRSKSNILKIMKQKGNLLRSCYEHHQNIQKTSPDPEVDR